MKRSKIIISTLLPAMLLVGCGGESQRSTTDSEDLTGLWRMSLESSQNNLKAESNISFTLVETEDGLLMKDCAGRADFNLNKLNGTIEGLPVSSFAINNNDTLSATGDLGVAKASKIAVTSAFDMGDMQLSADELGAISFTDLCVLSSNASVVGLTANDTISATSLYNGNPLLVEINVMGNLKKGDFTLAKGPALGEASVRLQSDSFKAPLNRTELTLTSGTLTITEDSLVWTKGSFSGTMPNGNVMTGSFSFENP
ncbi:hypothetical protein A9Q81_03845 [Gammaproteobacteria bacterium 42_54_T18]|nr:hypothetical protein A9Q81_03845 [Gammaproteobacteria bacterium 42_54_T18]